MRDFEQTNWGRFRCVDGFAVDGCFLLGQNPVGKIVKETGNSVQRGEALVDEVTPAEYGAAYAIMSCEAVGLTQPLIWGDAQEMLDENKGVYQFDGSNQVGYQGAHLVAGHNWGGFRKLQDMKKGDAISVNTGYGNFIYEVTKCTVGEVSADYANIVDREGNDLFDLNTDEDTLFLYTCYPFDSEEVSSQRLVVEAHLSKIQ